MRSIIRTNAVTVLMAVIGVLCAMAGAQVPDDLAQRRARLAAVKAGTIAVQAQRSLGKPDEVRRVGVLELLDGTRVSGGYAADHRTMEEAERWVYGPLGKGMFAATGYLSVTSDGVVIAATSPDFFCTPGARVPHIVHAVSDAAVKAPGNRVCRIVTIEQIPAQGDTPSGLKVQVAIKNDGLNHFDVEHPAATHIRWLLVVEICDAKGVLLFRDENSHYSCFHPQGKLHILSVPAGAERSDILFVSPATGFGSLPAGIYFLRVYFPLDGWEYYPSNRVQFEVKGE